MDFTNLNLLADSGTSFVDYLRKEQPDLLPNMAHFQNAIPSLDTHDLPHATTVVAMTFADGVIMAGDRRATAGLSIAYRNMDKVLRADAHSGIAISGAAGIAMELVKLFQLELEHYEKMAGEELSFEGKANQLSFMIRNNLPMAMRGLVVIPLFAGYDLTRKTGRVFDYDTTGGRYEERSFTATGSGAVHARNWIKASFKRELPQEDAVNISIRSLFAAADEDAGTGGPDLVRKIFPSVAIITADGFKYLEDAEIEERSISLLSGPEQGGDR